MQRAALISVLLALMLCASCSARDTQPAPADLCSFEGGPCIRALDGHAVGLMLTPAPPWAMSDLEFRVTAPSAVEPYMINLVMPGMQMGINRVALKRADDGSYSGSGVIPRCPTGGAHWRAEVMMRDGRVAGFDFEVR